jgi:hypothetical protein
LPGGQEIDYVPETGEITGPAIFLGTAGPKDSTGR